MENEKILNMVDDISPVNRMPAVSVKNPNYIRPELFLEEYKKRIKRNNSGNKSG